MADIEINVDTTSNNDEVENKDIETKEVVEDEKETTSNEVDTYNEEKEEVSTETNETSNEEPSNEENELEKLKAENEMLKKEKLMNSLDFMSDEDKASFDALDLDLDTKSKMVDYLKNYRAQPKDISMEASIVNDNNYDDQFDENGDVKLKDLQDLL